MQVETQQSSYVGIVLFKGGENSRHAQDIIAELQGIHHRKVIRPIAGEKLSERVEKGKLLLVIGEVFREIEKMKRSWQAMTEAAEDRVHVACVAQIL